MSEYMENEVIENKKTARGPLRKVLKFILWFLIVWAVLLLLLQAVLSPKVMTKIVNRFAAEYVDGSLTFGKASVSMFKRFPTMTLSLEDVSVTYPAERHEEAEAAGPQGHLLRRGCGREADTLAHFKRFTASINVSSLLFGKINLPYVSLVKPRIFAHQYADGTCNWDMFLFEESEEDNDTSSFTMPKLVIGRISLREHPHIVYTDSRDTLFAMIDINRVGFNGRLNTWALERNRIGLELDSMMVAGRLGADTIAVGMERLYLLEQDNKINVDMAAKALAATKSFGRMDIPVNVTGSVIPLNDSVPAFKVEDFLLDVATIPLRADIEVRLLEGRTGVDGRVTVKDCRLNPLLRKYAEKIIPDASKISTDAKISLSVDCSGYYDHSTGRLPDLRATLDIPASKTTHSDIGKPIGLEMAVKGATDKAGRLNLSIDKAIMDAEGLDIDITGSLADLLGNDPRIGIQGKLNARLDSLVRYLPEDFDINATGAISAEINGDILMSQLDFYQFSQADLLKGKLQADNIDVQMPSDTIGLYINKLNIYVGSADQKSRRDSTKVTRFLGMDALIDSTKVRIKDELFIEGKTLKLSAKNSAAILTEHDTTKVYPFSGKFNVGTLLVEDAVGTRIDLNGSQNSFSLRPKRGNRSVPVLRLTSTNKRLNLKSGPHRAIINTAKISATAALNTVEEKQKREHFLDSIQVVYPDIPRDSLFRHHLSLNRGKRQIPDWMKEDDFRQYDLDIRLDETLAKYFKEWDLDGSIGAGSCYLITPYFPYANSIDHLAVDFDNNRIGIDSLRFSSGRSNLAFKGELTGLKRALLGRGRLNLDADITSTRLDCLPLWNTISAGLKYEPEVSDSVYAEVSDDELMDLVYADTGEFATDTTTTLILPANLNANIRIRAKSARYSKLSISSLKANLIMKERCLQITETEALSNMGSIGFEAFYSTKSKRDMKAGFCLDLKDITAEKAVQMVPSIDTLLPILKSFEGLLNCEVAATTDIDRNMNILTPSMKGVMRLTGDNLSVKNDKMFNDLAKLLKFKDKKEGYIDHMSVEGIISDNVIEIFPFVLDIDRYTLAMSGIQNLDMSYRYHASIIQSPLVFRIGVDIFGDDFDNMKFKIGKPKYKNADVPVFSSVIDQTKMNLLESIRNIFDMGVDNAVKENKTQSIINTHKKNIGYVRVVDMKMEDLSDDEKAALNEEENETINTESNE